MPDIATIGAVLSSIKTATDIAKVLRETNFSLEQAELKLKIADLLVALADAKIKLTEVQEILTEKDDKIQELEDAFQSKDSLIRHLDAYYNDDGNGNPVGEPFCLRCWETDHKKRQLVQAPRDRFTKICTSCGHQYDGFHSETIRRPQKQ